VTRHVPISEFKDHVSELVAAVEGGEVIVITRHGRPAAHLVAAPIDQDERRKRAENAFAALAEIRAEQRARGMSATIAEMIEWKNEGRR
jgi:prevent-host-death family protein